MKQIINQELEYGPLKDPGGILQLEDREYDIKDELLSETGQKRRRDGVAINLPKFENIRSQKYKLLLSQQEHQAIQSVEKCPINDVAQAPGHWLSKDAE